MLEIMNSGGKVRKDTDFGAWEKITYTGTAPSGGRPNIVKMNANEIFVQGSSNSSSYPGWQSFKYTVSTKTFTRITDFTPTLYSWGAINGWDDVRKCVLTMGGVGANYSYNNRMARYYPETNTVEEITPIPANRLLTGDAFGNIYGRKMYYYGGYPSSTSWDLYMQIYDLDTNVFTKGAYLGQEIRAHTTAIVGNKIYLYSGNGRAAVRGPQLYCYDITANTWTTKANGPVGSAYYDVVVVGTNLYFLIPGTWGGTNRNAIFKYDTVADKWTEMKTSDNAYLSYRNQTASWVADGYWYVFGGYINTLSVTSELWRIKLPSR